jgi:mRNA interferase MazF
MPPRLRGRPSPRAGGRLLGRPRPDQGLRAGEVASFAIVSAEQLNQAPLAISLAVPLTRTDFGSPLHLEVAAAEDGLKERSFAMPEQLRAISHERLNRRLGTLRPKTLEELLKRCRLLLR